MFDFKNMMGKVEEAQAKMKEAQASLHTLDSMGESGGGMVHARVNGNRKVISLSIDDSLLNKEDKEMTQDLVIAAVNKAIENIEPKIQEHLKSATEGILPNIPGFNMNNFM